MSMDDSLKRFEEALEPENVEKHVRGEMESGEPPETKQAYDRLLKEGFSEEEVMGMLIKVVQVRWQMDFTVMGGGIPCGKEHYAAMLKELPKLP